MDNSRLPIVATARARILNEVADRAGVDVAHLLGPNRKYKLVRARHEAMWRLNLLGMSLPRIGKWMNRDHSTVLHGIRQHQKRIEEGRA